MSNRSNEIDERGLFYSDQAQQDSNPKPYATEAAVRSEPIRPSNPAANANKGHRERLRQRFEKAGENALADYELLELLLYRSLPRRDTKPIAKELIRKFGSFGAVLAAEPDRLAEVKGVKSATTLDLKIVAAAARNMIKTGVHQRELLSSWSAVLEYCTAAMAYESKEQFRILFLDKKNRLIADEIQQVGTIDHAPVYPREVLKRSLELAATAIILVHNHPSGDPTPSRADIEMTKKIMEAIKPLGIVVHDHIIIGKNGHASLRGLQLI